MPFSHLLRQTSAGVLVGVSAVTYALSFGAILFSGPLAKHIGIGLGLSLTTAVVGALLGLLAQERTFIGGPDSKIVAVLASIGGTLGALRLDPMLTLKLALVSMLFVSILSAMLFFALAKFKLANLVRYIPFSVLAGFLAATGWLMMNAALTIASGSSVTSNGVLALIADPLNPELIVTIGIAASLFAFRSRIPQSLLIPLVMAVSVMLVVFIVTNGWCGSGTCRTEDWYFAELHDVRWVPPWEIGLALADAAPLARQIPAMLVATFVGLMSVLLSTASLELIYQREFDMDRTLKVHAASAGVAALTGGFVGVVSPGATTLNRDAGGGAWSGVVAAAICFAVLAGAEGLVEKIPRPALAGLILYLGANLLKHWLWDQRKSITRYELVEVMLILVLIAKYGYLVGFLAGLIISSVVFVVTYGQLPLAGMATDLSLFPSSVVRSPQQAAALKKYGARVALFRLRGYVFFGSANKIDHLFSAIDAKGSDAVVVDLSDVSGMDRSAMSVFQRILMRFRGQPIEFYFVIGDQGLESMRSLAANTVVEQKIEFFSSLDSALEFAENRALSWHGPIDTDDEWLGFLDSEVERKTFLGYCQFRHLATGETLCRQGDLSNEIYFVANGEFNVMNQSKNPNGLRLAKLGRGAMAGEMAFYSGESRSASINALGEADVYVLTKEAHARMREHHAELATQFDRMVICKIAESLRRTSRLLATLI